MRTRVKICGITRLEDLQAAARAGADAIGLVFYPPSPRAVDVASARVLVAAAPPFVTTVGLFVDMAPDEVRSIVAATGIDLVQFHGNETPEQCRAVGRPYIKAVRMAPEVDLEQLAATYHDARGLLLDSYDRDRPGGTGETFDWARIPTGLSLPVVLAGGLRPDNVAQAVAEVAPWAVDVSSGVEQAKGIKDPDKIVAFIRGVERGEKH